MPEEGKFNRILVAAKTHSHLTENGLCVSISPYHRALMLGVFITKLAVSGKDSPLLAISAIR